MRRPILSIVPLLIAALALAAFFALTLTAAKYPLSPTQAKVLRSVGDREQVRTHGWAILEKMTDKVKEPGSSVPKGEIPPLWDQQFDDANVWKNKCELSLLGTMCSQPAPTATVPPPAPPDSSDPCALPKGPHLKELDRLAEIPAQIGFPSQDVMASDHALATLLFNKEASDFIIRKNLQTREGLLALANNQAGRDRCSDFSQGSVIVKLIWGAVKQDNHISVFDSTKLAAAEKHNTLGEYGLPSEPAWASVQIDMSHPEKECSAGGDGINGPMSIMCFYHWDAKCAQIRPLGAAGVNHIGCVQTGQATQTLLLLGMHIITAEQKDWVWSTYYWTLHPDLDPNGRDQPKEIKQRAPWNHYAMMTVMDGAKTFRAPTPAYNPYLEGPKANSLTSNCVYCHSMAHINSQGVTARTIFSDGMPSPCAYTGLCGKPPYTPDSPKFQGMTATHLLWSLVNEQDGIQNPNGGAFNMKKPDATPQDPPQ